MAEQRLGCVLLLSGFAPWRTINGAMPMNYAVKVVAIQSKNDRIVQRQAYTVPAMSYSDAYQLNIKLKRTDHGFNVPNDPDGYTHERHTEIVVRVRNLWVPVNDIPSLLAEMQRTQEDLRKDRENRKSSRPSIAGVGNTTVDLSEDVND